MQERLLTLKKQATQITQQAQREKECFLKEKSNLEQMLQRVRVGVCVRVCVCACVHAHAHHPLTGVNILSCPRFLRKAFARRLETFLFAPLWLCLYVFRYFPVVNRKTLPFIRLFWELLKDGKKNLPSPQPVMFLVTLSALVGEGKPQQSGEKIC